MPELARNFDDLQREIELEGDGMKIEVTVPTEQDYEEYRISGLNAEACLDGRVKLICEDDSGHRATSFMMKDMFERLG